MRAPPFILVYIHALSALSKILGLVDQNEGVIEGVVSLRGGGGGGTNPPGHLAKSSFTGRLFKYQLLLKIRLESNVLALLKSSCGYLSEYFV